ncbi:pyridoxamine 5'-phosphate oxidase family protein [Halomicrococcus sp. SG-WS-1]|uniref:pyridoxamine 5'-phosphate oxidase family protein n=1 Tax=Halomicrococcus sp. SG-WS-1 TaxID=3439057 RepID=UPI003F7AB9EF
MEDVRSVQMADAERDEFLQHGGTGVISFETDEGDPPYQLPVSYGFDVDGGAFYFRLSFAPDAEKEEVVDEDRPVSFVAYDRTDGGWRSVVATGRLEEVTEAEIGTEAAEAMRTVEIPIVDVFDRHPREVTFRFFRLDADDVTGRKEAQSES